MYGNNNTKQAFPAVPIEMFFVGTCFFNINAFVIIHCDWVMS